jgi:hypothetical protein
MASDQKRGCKTKDASLRSEPLWRAGKRRDARLRRKQTLAGAPGEAHAPARATPIPSLFEHGVHPAFHLCGPRRPQADLARMAAARRRPGPPQRKLLLHMGGFPI